MPSKRPERQFRDIVENIGRIQRYTSEIDSRALYADPMRIDAVERCFQRLTEAAARLVPAAEMLAPGVAWTKIRAFGNHLRHGYDRLQPDTIWRAIIVDLPPLKAACLAAMTRLPDPDD